MPASRFFVMLESKRKLQAHEHVLQLYIARSPAVDDKHFASLLEFFRTHGLHFDGDAPKSVEQPKRPEIKAGSKEAHAAIQRMLGGDRRLKRKKVMVKPDGR